jgi:uncharacterized membrane protein
VKTRFSWILAIGLTALAFGASFYLYAALPERIPIHWNIRGQIDGYGDKSWAVFALPGGMGLMIGLFALLPWLSPKPFEVDSFRQTYLFIMVLVVALFGYIHALSLIAASGRAIDFSRALLGGLFLFFALLGNVMGKVKRNFYVGIRVPWTLANDRVWNDTHRLAAWLWVACGLIGFVIAMAGFPVLAFAPLAVAVVVPIVHSFLLYRRLDRRGEV